MDKVTRIHFEDHGQDFLWWDIDAQGKVIDCGPFQASVWVGSRVDLPVEEFTAPYFLTKGGDFLRLNYPIESIEEKEVQHAS
tara:strand:+ start:694 stop:939 length:246 start_codon:yes stop_codon:yes gene_type:complete